jgi:uncharacterized protein YgbK (DUF1537 family)
MTAGAIAAIADDLTGAAEVAAVGWRRGLAAEVHIEAGLAPRAPLVVLDTDSRTRAESEARVRSRAAGAWLAARHPDLVYKKVDSVLRGWVRAELEELLTSLGWERALLLPANPGLGRVVRDGRYFVEGRPVHETDFARDPLHPIRSSDVLELLGPGGARPLALGRPGSRALAEGITVGDAACREDLVAWAGRVSAGLLAAGGAEFFDALLQARGFELRAAAPAVAPEPAGRRLFVCGSTSERSRRALQAAREVGVHVLPMPEALFHGRGATHELMQRWVDAAGAALEESRAVVLAIDRPGSDDASAAARLGGLLVDAAERVLRRGPVSGLFVEGGATAAAVIHRLGWTRLTVLRELAPGVVSLRAEEPQAPPLTMKPGSYAWPEAVWG